MRNFGIPDVTSRPASSGAQQPQAGSHYSAGARADSNVIQMFPSQQRQPLIDSADADFGALCFAIGAFWSPWVLVGVGLIIWSLFF